MNELLAGKAPKQTVLVAIIDNGIDTAHVDLKANLWTNPKEIGGNGKDDDNNGYVDDVHGWNFIGGRDGKDVHFDTFEVTREYARCHDKRGGERRRRRSPTRRAATKVDADYEKQRKQTQSATSTTTSRSHDVDAADHAGAQAGASRRDSLTPERVRALQPTNPQIDAGATDLSRARVAGRDAGGRSKTASSRSRGSSSTALNPDYNPRTIVGDNYTDPSRAPLRQLRRDGSGREARHARRRHHRRGSRQRRRHRRHRARGEVHDDSHRARRRRARQGRRQRDPLRGGQRRADHQHELRQGVLAVQGGGRRRREVRRRARAC